MIEDHGGLCPFDGEHSFVLVPIDSIADALFLGIWNSLGSCDWVVVAMVMRCIFDNGVAIK